MAKIPVHIDMTSTSLREVTIVVYVDGKEYTTATTKVEEWAIPFVSEAVVIQAEDPDYEAAADVARESGGKLPPGY